MDLDNLILQRSSVRKFTEKEIENEKIKSIIDAARMAPSAKNLQPWFFVVIKNDKLKDIKKCYDKDWIKTAPLIIVVCADYLNSWIRNDGKSHADIDCAIAIDHLTLKAAELGLGTCWICKFDVMKAAEIINCPQGAAPMAMIPVGYPAKDSAREKIRKNKDEVVFYETFLKTNKKETRLRMDFDKIIDRRNTNSVKYDLLKKRFGRDDLLSMWVADMDFELPDFLKNVLENYIKNSVFGYTMRSSNFFRSVSNWMKDLHNWNVNPVSVLYSPGVVPSLNFSVLAFSEETDKIIVQPPVYYPFFNAVTDHKRQIIENQLILKDNKYYINFDDLEKQCADKNVKMMFFCNPHNPGGRVWTFDEVKKVSETCYNNDVLLVSDEIHADIVFKGKHTPAASIDEKLADNTITLNSPTKSFNIAAMETSYAIITHLKKRNKFNQILTKQHIGMGNIFGNLALESVYSENGKAWLNSMLNYVESNIETLYKQLDNYKNLKIMRPEATYLVWMDFRETKIKEDNLEKPVINEAKLALNNGEMFGSGGKGFMRINLATSSQNTEEAIKRIKSIL